MRKGQTEIIESNIHHLLRLKPDNIKEYSYREKNGFLKMNPGQGLLLESGEFKGRNEMTKVLPVHVRKRFFPDNIEAILSASGSFPRIEAQMLSSLSKVKELDWEIIFKVLKKNKFIKKKGLEKGATEFNHHSILVRFKKPEWRNFIEIGEGNTSGSVHNISGLLNRFDDIIKCNAGTAGKTLPVDVPLILSPGA